MHEQPDPDETREAQRAIRPIAFLGAIWATVGFIVLIVAWQPWDRGADPEEGQRQVAPTQSRLHRC